MVGDPDGFKEKVKMGLSGIQVDTGRQGRRVLGMAAQIFLARLIKISSTPLKDPDVLEGTRFEKLLFYSKLCSFSTSISQLLLRHMF